MIANEREPSVLHTMRRLLLVLLLVFMAGTAADLLLLEHYDGGWQVVPLVLLAIGVVTAAMALGGRPRGVLALRIVMALFIAAGLVGLGLHYLGNSEFQREMDPTLAGWPLFVKVLTAKAPPALAPASMIHMGLLGLLGTYHHPALPRVARRSSTSGASV